MIEVRPMTASSPIQTKKGGAIAVAKREKVSIHGEIPEGPPKTVRPVQFGL